MLFSSSSSELAWNWCYWCSFTLSGVVARVFATSHWQSMILHTRQWFYYQLIFLHWKSCTWVATLHGISSIIKQVFIKNSNNYDQISCALKFTNKYLTLLHTVAISCIYKALHLIHPGDDVTSHRSFQVDRHRHSFIFTQQRTCSLIDNYTYYEAKLL